MEYLKLQGLDKKGFPVKFFEMSKKRGD